MQAPLEADLIHVGAEIFLCLRMKESREVIRMPFEEPGRSLTAQVWIGPMFRNVIAYQLPEHRLSGSHVLR